MTAQSLTSRGYLRKSIIISGNTGSNGCPPVSSGCSRHLSISISKSQGGTAGCGREVSLGNNLTASGTDGYTTSGSDGYTTSGSDGYTTSGIDGTSSQPENTQSSPSYRIIRSQTKYNLAQHYAVHQPTIKLVQRVQPVVVKRNLVIKRVYHTPKPIVKIRTHVNVIHIKRKPKIIIHHRTLNKYIVHKPEAITKNKTHTKTIHIHRKANEFVKHVNLNKYVIERPKDVYKTKTHVVNVDVQGQPLKRIQHRFIRKYIVNNPTAIDGQLTDNLTGKLVLDATSVPKEVVTAVGTNNAGSTLVNYPIVASNPTTSNTVVGTDGSETLTPQVMTQEPVSTTAVLDDGGVQTLTPRVVETIPMVVQNSDYGNNIQGVGHSHLLTHTLQSGVSGIPTVTEGSGCNGSNITVTIGKGVTGVNNSLQSESHNDNIACLIGGANTSVGGHKVYQIGNSNSVLESSPYDYSNIPGAEDSQINC